MATKKRTVPPVTDADADPFVEGQDQPERVFVQKQEENKTKFLKVLNQLSHRAVVELREEFGIVVPLRLVVDRSNGRRWAYLCKRCLHQAFEFEGIQFSYKAGDKWVLSDTPPLGVPIEDLPWVQDHPKASRHGKTPFDLSCQFCGAEVMLNKDRSLLPKRIVLIDAIEKMWEKREKKAQAMMRRWGTFGG